MEIIKVYLLLFLRGRYSGLSFTFIQLSFTGIDDLIDRCFDIGEELLVQRVDWGRVEGERGDAVRHHVDLDRGEARREGHAVEDSPR